MNPEHARRLKEVLDVVFQVELNNAEVALRAFLQGGRGWPKLNSELPAGAHSWRQLLEAAVSSMLRFGLVDDDLFNRLAVRAAGAGKLIEQVRLELVHPERLPPAWTRIGPTGGAIERIEADPHDHNRLLCCAHIAFTKEATRMGWFRSVDRGASWSRLEIERDPSPLVRWIVFDPRQVGHVFLCTDNGLWSSEDHGESWTRSEASSSNVPVWQMRFHPIHEGAKFMVSGQDVGGGGTSAGGGMSAGAETDAMVATSELGTEYAVQRVAGRKPGLFQFFDPDAGEWTSIDLGLPQFAAAYATRDWRKLWVATNKNILRTDDGGRTFRAMDSVGKTHVWDMAVHPDDSDSLLVATDKGIYRSENGGLRFQRACDAKNARQLIFADGAWFAPTAQGPLRSRDDGRSWQPVGEGFPLQRCWSLTRAADGALFAGADGDGVYRLDPGSDAWIPRSDGLLDIPVGRPAFATPTEWAVPSEFGLHVTLDCGVNWSHAGPAGLAVAADRRLFRLAVGQACCGVQLTSDAGKNWHTTSALHGIVFWLRFGGEAVWARTNYGQLARLKADLNWQDDGPSAAQNDAGSPEQTTIRLTDIVVIGEHWTAIATGGTLYQRRDASAAWEVIERNPAELSYAAGTWRLATTRIGWFAWRYEGGMCSSPDPGRPWREVALPSDVTAIGGICADPGSADVAWAAAIDGSLFRLAAAGDGWQWRRVTERWGHGYCGYLESIQAPRSIVGAGTGGLFSFPVRNELPPTTSSN